MTSLTLGNETSARHFQSLPTELQATDAEDLARFLASVFGGEFGIWQSRFAHWWSLNPAWHAQIPRGWIVRSAAGQIVAFTANIPFAYVD